VLRDQVELPDGGIVVESVVKDSLAEKLGLQRHDVLVEVQGKAVGGTPDVRAALGEVKAGEKVTAVVVRKGLKKALETTK
jgi:serine protease Do